MLIDITSLELPSKMSGPFHTKIYLGEITIFVKKSTFWRPFFVEKVPTCKKTNPSLFDKYFWQKNPLGFSMAAMITIIKCFSSYGSTPSEDFKKTQLRGIESKVFAK